jgi:hypothetical protein
MKPPNELFPRRADSPGPDTARLIRSDADALVRASNRDLPGIDHTARLLRERVEARNLEGWLMKQFRFIQSRPWLASGLVAAASALVVSLVPVSYDRVSGYETRLELASPHGSAGPVALVAQQFGKAVHAGSLSVQTVPDGPSGGMKTTLMARSSDVSRVFAEQSAQAFVRGLTERGYHAAASVKPIVEHHLGSMVAMAADRVQEIRINAKGKSADQIASEIRSQLAAAGLPGAMVNVTQADGQTKIEIRAENHDSKNGVEPKFTIDTGKEGTARQRIVKIDKHGGMTDAQLQAEVEKQLRAQGSTAKVRVTNGKIEIDNDK